MGCLHHGSRSCPMPYGLFSWPHFMVTFEKDANLKAFGPLTRCQPNMDQEEWPCAKMWIFFLIFVNKGGLKKSCFYLSSFLLLYYLLFDACTCLRWLYIPYASTRGGLLTMIHKSIIFFGDAFKNNNTYQSYPLFTNHHNHQQTSFPFRDEYKKPLTLN